LLGGVVAIVGAIVIAHAVYEAGKLIHPTPIGTNAQGHVVFRVDWPRTEGHHVLPRGPAPQIPVRDINGDPAEFPAGQRSES
jgi:hypothetical protein